MFQAIYRYSIKISNSGHISTWKSKGFSDESIKSASTSYNIRAPSLEYIGIRTREVQQ